MRPRLAYLFSRYPVVTHTFIDNEILALENAGWDIVIASLSPPKNDFRHPRLDSLRAPVLHSPPSTAQRALQHFQVDAGTWPAAILDSHREQYGPSPDPVARWRQVAPLATALAKARVDHIHLHFANRAAHSALLLHQLTGIPFSLTPQAQDFLVDLPSLDLLRDLCHHAAFVVAPCHFAKEELARLCPGQSQKLVTIYNGIDPSPYPTARPATMPRPLRLVSVGRLLEFKGFHHLIEAIAQARALGAESTLEIIGDGPFAPRLHQLVADLALVPHVTFTGTASLDQMRAAFASADAFALACCQDEHGAMDMLPTVITEAMLCSLPVLSTRLAAIPEQVVDGVTGILSNPNNIPAIASSIVNLATSSGLAISLGQAGRQRALETFAISKTLPDLEAMFSRSPTGQDANPTPRPLLYADLSLPGRVAAAAEATRSLAQGSYDLWLAPPLNASPSDFSSLGHALLDVLWLPDGVALEMEWQRGGARRTLLESLRPTAPATLSGEPFFQAARAALWLATQAPRLSSITSLIPLGDREKLALDLMAELLAREPGQPAIPPLVSSP